jgi:ketosteroid isomerase-like protein
MRSEVFTKQPAPVLAACLLLSACTRPAGEEPRAVVEAFQNALLAGDAKAAAERLAPDVLVYEFGALEASREEYAASHLPADIKALAGATVQRLDQRQVVDGDLALVTTRSRVSGAADGKPFDVFSTETVVLRRDGAGWRIAHIHWSSHPAKKP